MYQVLECHSRWHQFLRPLYILYRNVKATKYSCDTDSIVVEGEKAKGKRNAPTDT